MYNDIEAELKERFEGAFSALKRELGRVRTGRASLSLLDGVTIEYYGTPTPLNQVATVKVAEARLITVAPWEKNLIGDIERAIHVSGLGISPSNDGAIIRLPIPALTGERRQELAKTVRKHGEDAKIAVRNARRDANDLLKSLQKDGEVTEDELHRYLAKIQEATDGANTKVDAIVAEKEQEILEI